MRHGDFLCYPYLRPEHDRAVATARAGLDPDAFATAWTEGRTMGLDRAVALALTREDKFEHACRQPR